MTESQAEFESTLKNEFSDGIHMKIYTMSEFIMFLSYTFVFWFVSNKLEHYLVFV